MFKIKTLRDLCLIFPFTDDFIQDLRQRVIGVPEISIDGLHYYKSSIRDAFGKRATHGVIQKTYSVTHLNVTEASRRYSPAQVVAVERVAQVGEPEQIRQAMWSGKISRSAWAQSGLPD